MGLWIKGQKESTGGTVPKTKDPRQVRETEKASPRMHSSVLLMYASSASLVGHWPPRPFVTLYVPALEGSPSLFPPLALAPSPLPQSFPISFHSLTPPACWPRALRPLVPDAPIYKPGPSNVLCLPSWNPSRVWLHETPPVEPRTRTLPISLSWTHFLELSVCVYACVSVWWSCRVALPWRCSWKVAALHHLALQNAMTGEECRISEFWAFTFL